MSFMESTHAAGIDPVLAQSFRVSARCGCFMQAARSLNIKSTQLRKHLAQLETQLQCSLFNHQDNGLALSREGLQLQAQLIALAHEHDVPVIEQPLIRLAVAESILHDILGRDLVSLLRRNASVRLTSSRWTANCRCERSVQMWCCGWQAPSHRCRARVSLSASLSLWRDWIICRISPNVIHG